MRKRWILVWRIVVLGVFLAAWQYLPLVAGVRRRIRWMDPFFISSPSRVYDKLTVLMVGNKAAGLPAVWPYLWNTLEATLIGASCGIAIGAVLGAILSNNDTLARIFGIYIYALNAVPRIALIPIIVLIVGPNLEASIVTSIMIVTFITFFNAFAGGRNVPVQMIQNAVLLGASPRHIMLHIRLPNVFLWTFAALPNAIAFGLLSVVFAEVLTGSKGMGSLIVAATSVVDSSLAFAVVAILSVVGIVLVVVAERLKRIVLHWA